MKNTIPGSLPRVFTLGEDIAVGCHNFGAAVGLLQNTEVNVRAALTPAVAADNLYQAAKRAKALAFLAQKTADQNAITFIMAATGVVKTHFGNTWSVAWADVGFVNNSLAVPDSMAARQALLLKNKLFFTANPTFEADQVGVTSDAAADRFAILSGARTTVNACKGDVAVRKAARDLAAGKLRRRLRGVIAELALLLPGDDGRWRSFGLNPPNATGLPDVPEGLEVTGGIQGHLTATFESAALADRYNVYRKIIGVDTDYVLVKSTTETETDLNTFTTGQVVSIRVSAVNNAGESQLSDPVEQTVP